MGHRPWQAIVIGRFLPPVLKVNLLVVRSTSSINMRNHFPDELKLKGGPGDDEDEEGEKDKEATAPETGDSVAAE
jgi:hypothetical protein